MSNYRQLDIFFLYVHVPRTQDLSCPMIHGAHRETSIMKMLAEDIKNGVFKSAYLLYGEEAYLRLQYRDRLKNALADPADTMNVSCFQGKGIRPEEIIDLAETLPFFADRRVILVEDSDFFKNKCDLLADYLPSMPDTACLIFVEAGTDRVNKSNRLYKAVKAKGRVVEFGAQSEATLTKWILGILKREKKQISRPALDLFLKRSGLDMAHISAELEKLICYTYGREEITLQDIQEICTIQIEDRIFDMVRAIAEKKQTLALNLYYDLLSLKKSPRAILSLIGRQFQKLLLVKSLMAKGYDQASIASKAQLHPFVAKLYMQQSRRFSQEQLEAALRDCVNSEEAVNTGHMEERLSVELLIMTCSQ